MNDMLFLRNYFKVNI